MYPDAHHSLIDEIVAAFLLCACKVTSSVGKRQLITTSLFSFERCPAQKKHFTITLSLVILVAGFIFRLWPLVVQRLREAVRLRVSGVAMEADSSPRREADVEPADKEGSGALQQSKNEFLSRFESSPSSEKSKLIFGEDFDLKVQFCNVFRHFLSLQRNETENDCEEMKENCDSALPNDDGAL
ncbi:unnamed protein product [Trypanosoma congolense IL3000]|uniref:WGS project CAEQ00000000 data, annotated contig 1732 n=1 Tax=Trypanosoma congolense (strain IL3000) TaxID=1068625 RepID=F9W8F5_TRYCI|nr:unnamed protein product [Trypanosoma congolense IL3000]